MAEVTLDRPKRWTYDEYSKLDEDHRYEVINAALLMAPAPDTWHQDWCRNLFRVLDAHVLKHKLGKLFFAPVDVILDSENIVQPDVIFIATNHLNIIQRRGIFGIPDLVVEIVSPGTARRDRHDKREIYARFGVKEYWIGDPANCTMEVFVLAQHGYELHSIAEQEGKLTSMILPGLEVDLAQVQ